MPTSPTPHSRRIGERQTSTISISASSPSRTSSGLISFVARRASSREIRGQKATIPALSGALSPFPFQPWLLVLFKGRERMGLVPGWSYAGRVQSHPGGGRGLTSNTPSIDSGDFSSLMKPHASSPSRIRACLLIREPSPSVSSEALAMTEFPQQKILWKNARRVSGPSSRVGALGSYAFA